MLKLNQIAYLFEGWSEYAQPLVRELNLLSGLYEERGALIEVYEALKDYDVIEFEGEYEDIFIIIKKP